MNENSLEIMNRVVKCLRPFLDLFEEVSLSKRDYVEVDPAELKGEMKINLDPGKICKEEKTDDDSGILECVLKFSLFAKVDKIHTVTNKVFFKEKVRDFFCGSQISIIVLSKERESIYEYPIIYEAKAEVLEVNDEENFIILSHEICAGDESYIVQYIDGEVVNG